MIRTTAGGGPNRAPSTDCHRHGPQLDQPEPSPWPAVSPVRETVTAAAPGDGASLEPGRAHEPSRAAAQVRGPGPAGPVGTGAANQAGGPVQESTGPRGSSGLTAAGRATVTAPAGDIDAAAAAYRDGLQEGKPLSERELAAAFGRTSRRSARPNGRSQAGIGCGLTGHALIATPGRQHRGSSSALRAMNACRRHPRRESPAPHPDLGSHAARLSVPCLTRQPASRVGPRPAAPRRRVCQRQGLRGSPG
jgi:hypothetical protein